MLSSRILFTRLQNENVCQHCYRLALCPSNLYYLECRKEPLFHNFKDSFCRNINRHDDDQYLVFTEYSIMSIDLETCICGLIFNFCIQRYTATRLIPVVNFPTSPGKKCSIYVYYTSLQPIYHREHY